MIDWRTLPSLPALRAFDAAVRAGSFSEAARTLNVTHAAIAQHVRTLEKAFGQTLMVRSGQGMTPTPEGALLATHLSEGFDAIATGCARLADLSALRPFTLSCTMGFAENWLMPRLGDFWAKHPDIDLVVHPNNSLVSFRDGSVDCAVRFGNGAWQGLEATELLTGDFIVVAAPALVQDTKVHSASELRDRRWVINDHRSEAHVFARDFGIDLDARQARSLPTNGMVLAAARSGLGFTMQSRRIVERDLADGTLVEVIASGSTNLGYWIVHPPGADTSRLRTVKQWMLSHV